MNILNQSTNITRKVIVSLICVLLLLILYFVIFSFSAQDADTSSGISYMISEKCAQIINGFSGGDWSHDILVEMAIFFEHPIRKFAHFAEYACMGVLVYTLLRQWVSRTKRLYLITTLWVFLSAAGDEFHQLFVPGRWGSFADVCLDTIGGIFAICSAVIIEKCYQYFRRKRRCLP